MRFAMHLLASTLLSLPMVSALPGQALDIPGTAASSSNDANAVRELILDGDWQAGLDRHYDRVLHVPGLATDPRQPTPGTLWYKRIVEIPAGKWTHATLTLKGARFAPALYVDGALVSTAEGGMAPTEHRFPLPAGKAITLEIALQSMNTLSPRDASAVPKADLWRNNVSSYLWDSVVLRLHGKGEIVRVTPFGDFKNNSVSLHWELTDSTPLAAHLRFRLLDEHGRTVIESEDQEVRGANGETMLALQKRIEPWSPESPHLYRLRTELTVSGRLVDAREQSFGLRSFAVHDRSFELNGAPYPIRMGTVVWHRWTRDPEAKEIAFNSDWFERNIVLRLKGLGANALRFHLGLPPERFLDLCDRDGVAVQMEWPFFHGVPASKVSLETQWRAWMDVAMRHPSVVIVQPWNETGEDQLKIAREALDNVLALYPPQVVNHRDVTAVHKYWWSLFENLGLYYDSATQFPQAIMVDEFGGDYLDAKGDAGAYPAAREAFARFLGRDNTRAERLQLQADANARVAEYWRRLGAAGFSPFCILASPEDGNTWFLGPSSIVSPEPKPVWAALAASWAPRSLSLELWNRNFAPAETIHTPLWFFNDTATATTLHATIHVLDASTSRDATAPVALDAELQPHTSQSKQIAIPLPDSQGAWRIDARLENVSQSSPILSSWQVRTFVPQASARLLQIPIGVAQDEMELRAMLSQLHLKVVAPEDPKASVLIGSRATWQRVTDDSGERRRFEARLHRGTPIVLLDAGPQPLGVGYSTGKQLGGPLEGAPTVSAPATIETAKLFGGVTVSFVETAEPESTVQEAEENKQLWDRIPRGATWLWNGLRGGLIVPAADMQVSGLGGKAMLAIWQARGADVAQMQAGKLFVYELAGYYAFSERGDDTAVAAKLRTRVKTMVDDAPALAGRVNPNAPIVVTDLGAIYRQGGATGGAESLTPMINAGKGLSRAPAVKLTFGSGSGTLILSQLLTAGRLLPGHAESGPGVYGLRYDPIAVQFVLNMLNAALDDSSTSR